MAKRTSRRLEYSAAPARSVSRVEARPRAKRAVSEAPKQSEAQKQSFPIVGAGASAGGLEAFTAFLKHLPSDSGMAFVLIQHLDPKQLSRLTDLLSRASRMPVLEVTADTTVKANHVYVISPGVCLSLSGGRLRTEPREVGRNLPIDHFLRSLAHDKSSNAIGIVLSGTASDGTTGLKAIKAEGGITFVQEPSSAKFDGMPRSAIAAGVADFVLPPAEIAKRVARLAKHPFVARKAEETDDAAQQMEFELNRVFHLLRTATGTDFTHYKPPTIRRRIHRRMVLNGSEKLSDYVNYLRENPGEVRALADDLLILVTAFFREPATFDALAARVFPEILRNRSPEQPVRIWVPGCATGEEAYSIAISLAEFLERSGLNVPFQIFATDLSEVALDKARAGKYEMPALAEVSPERLKRFFTKANGSLLIQKSIRESCIFAKQNITKDPPFHNLDLISCCNVMIYFGSVLQRKALSIFHYALKPGGFLVLGPLEGVSALPGAFSPLDKKIKLYAKQPGFHPLNVPFTAIEPFAARVPGSANENLGVTIDVQKAAERMLLAHYAPAGVIVDDGLNVVHVRGDTDPYLQLASGEPTYSLLRMAREGLVVGLRTAFVKAKRTRAATTQVAHLKQNGQLNEVSLKVIPINGPVRAGGLHFMVLFEDVAPVATSGPVRAEGRAGGAKPAKAGPGSARENTRLKQELAATREYLQSIIEEQEASTEELKSANEEAEASNEELETAKEELQSANEELNTLNDELKTRNTALMEVNNDLINVLTSIAVPLVMVGKDLRIRRFTQVIEPMLNLIDSDVGRLISDLKPNIDVPDLAELLGKVAAGARPVAREIQGPDGRWYFLRALHYKTDSQIDGAILVLLDIDAVKRSRDYAEAVVQTIRQPLVILNQDLKIGAANRAFYETFKVSKDETENRFIYDLGNSQWNIPKLREALEKILPEAGELKDFEVEHDFQTIGRKTMLLSAREVQYGAAPYDRTILLAIEDITARIARQNLEQELARIGRALTMDELSASIAHEVSQPLSGVITNAEAGLRWLGAAVPDVENAQQTLALIIRDAGRAHQVIRRVREFLKRDDLEMAAFDINDVVREAIAFAEADLQRGEVSLRVELSGELPSVRGDLIQLQQVVLNLLMNSRDAMASGTKGSRELLVSSREFAAPRGRGVLVTVRDSGSGIKPQDMDRMFDTFFTTKPAGMGLGLSISKSIIEAHGGRIWAAPNDGPGLTVQFSLPAASENPS